MEAAIFLFEVPTGVVADVYSRRLSVAVGYVVCGGAFLLQGLVPTWPAMLAGMALLGLGETFLSGAREAWVADELEAEGRGDEAAAVFVRGSRWSNLGTVAGAWTGVAVASRDLGAPAVVSGVLFLALAAAVRLAWPERGFRKAAGGAAGMGATASAGLAAARKSPVLLAVLGLVLLGGLASEGFDRLWVNHLEFRHGFPALGPLGSVWWFAVLSSGSMAGAWLLLGLLERRVATRGPDYPRVLMWTHLGIGAGVAGFALAGSFVGAVACWLLARSMRRATEPLRLAWVNAEAQPELRATMLSFNGQAHSIGEIGGGVASAGVAAAWGVQAALVASGGMAAAAGVWARLVKGRAAGPGSEGP